MLLSVSPKNGVMWEPEEHLRRPKSGISLPMGSRSIDALSEAGDAAAFEIFGELCYHVKDEDGLPAVSAAKEEGKTGFLWRKSSSESSLVDKERTGEVRRSYFDARRRVARGSRGGTAFPPPITTIGSGGKPRVTLKSCREDGRFVLREVRVPMQRQLQATRENGRLTMRVMRQENEEEEEKKEKGEGAEKEEGEDFVKNSEKIPTD
ncbi:hypothetical protein HPP92_013382 [Vanilla planifolia]|uniref:FAF domain-containing protein n=1 Tax=Vanilla planifolia TaxID=51239 RepID=A0A835QVH5_VANPL|nr:hypothetical protein HPP92_013382 [Vanilla planifolia]